jgi:hypothetical protein
VDSYTLELQRHGLESVEREVRWLNELISTERRGEEPVFGDDPSATSATQRTNVSTHERVGEQPVRPEPVRAKPATGNDKE